MTDPIITFLFGVIVGISLMGAVSIGLVVYIVHRAVTRD